MKIDCINGTLVLDWIELEKEVLLSIVDGNSNESIGLGINEPEILDVLILQLQEYRLRLSDPGERF